MTDKVFVPKNSWQKKEMNILMAKSNGKSLIGNQKTWHPEFFKMPSKKDESSISKGK